MAADGETAAVKVMLVPAVVEVLEAVRVVVEDVVPEELLELVEPQPVLSSAERASDPKRIARNAK